MLCSKPFVDGSTAYGCGQCLSCRIKRRSTWAHRLLLESLHHGSVSFVTLTYSEDGIPVTKKNLSTLSIRDYQLFMKRLRKAVRPLRLRFYLVGEYGDETFRPHYHAVLFGVDACRYGDSRLAPRQPCVCVPCSIIRSCWPKGFSSTSIFSRELAQYICGYVVKKMTGKDDVRLQGRLPEFARMSLRPGIGALSLQEVRESCVASGYVEKVGDVPAGIRHGSRVMPLGRYLRGRLREELGVANPRSAAVDEFKKEMYDLLLAAKTDTEVPTLKAQILKKYEGKRLRIAARLKIFKGRKSI